MIAVREESLDLGPIPLNNPDTHWEHHMLCSLESLGYEIKETFQMVAGNNIIAVKKV